MTKNEVSKPTVVAKRPISAGDKVAVEASKTYANKNSKGATTKVPYRMYLNYLFKLKYLFVMIISSSNAQYTVGGSY